ncbi:MAG TPA: phosphotransferase [Gammaproteobacteria bacterium]|nr:phosphotransferase [Gammaproteobacteria bacterium]
MAASRYPLKVGAIELVQHGENTTFRVDAKGGQKYLLRVHRPGYHTKAAIQEELAWLDQLSQAGLSVPKPIAAKSGEWVETVGSHDLPAPLSCSLLHWLDGRFIRKSVSPKHLYRVGAMVADLQTRAARSVVVHRRYWGSEGLVGAGARFGSVDSLAGIRPELQAAITRARKRVLQELREFERRFPQRQGLIHADLHFGNILSAGGRLLAIDFDDCGHGFHAYDLAVPLLSAEGMVGNERRARLPELEDALILGYSSKKTWDRHDERVFPYFIAARRLAMLGWLSSRRDHPKLKKLLKRAAAKAVRSLQRRGLAGLLQKVAD